ncbi:MAG TPA: GNAT family N-acetyltransferase [Solirubrobacteraceae bacterium]|nr:GNAT family N-acetyltransferase [Solirubrobacteraceae bacterium]
MRIERTHAHDGFDCGEPALNDWLATYALASDAAGSSRVFVTTEDGTNVVGYYALAAAEVEPDAATVALLARLAVDREHQGRGVGASLLKHALVQSIAAAGHVGMRAILVHAKHEKARAWYERWGFERSPTDPLHLVLLMKDIRATLSP